MCEVELYYGQYILPYKFFFHISLKLLEVSFLIEYKNTYVLSFDYDI